MVASVVLLPREAAYAWFPEVWAHVGDLCQTDPMGRTTAENLMADLIAGRKQAWLAQTDGVCDAACITEIDGDVGRILWTAGRAISHTEELLGHFENYALLKGCREIETCGRRGWERLLKQRGYSTMRVILRKSL